MCVYYMTVAPEGSPKVFFFMEKPGKEPATPGLQDIGLNQLFNRMRSKLVTQSLNLL